MSSIPIVFVTAMIKKDEAMHRGGRIGGRDLLAKPVTRKRLIKGIERYPGI